MHYWGKEEPFIKGKCGLFGAVWLAPAQADRQPAIQNFWLRHRPCREVFSEKPWCPGWHQRSAKTEYLSLPRPFLLEGLSHSPARHKTRREWTPGQHPRRTRSQRVFGSS
jgi:hypothetical protein